MKFGVAAKPDDARRVRISELVLEYLDGKADVVVQEELAQELKGDVKSAPLSEMRVDANITVGGDGTILHVLQQNPAPVFGINVGELGFLTEIEPIELMDGLNRLVSGDYFVESRLKIAVHLNEKRLPNATNEVVVKTEKASKILQMEVAYNEKERHRMRADGIILATPTGSTSYAMSAGGPIVDPHVEALIVVPLAAFSLSSRPMVVPTSERVEIRLLQREKDALLVVDGQYETRMHMDDRVIVTAAEERAKFIRFRHHFYNRLRERLQ